MLVSSKADYQTGCSSDIMITTENALKGNAFFEEGNYAHTLRTIDHMLNEQQAEMAVAPFVLDTGKNKPVLVSPPYSDVQRLLFHQYTAISLLSADHPFRTRYISHAYYIYTFKHILI